MYQDLIRHLVIASYCHLWVFLQLTAPPLKYLLPAHEFFKKNLKRVHLPAMVSYVTMEADSPPLNPTLYGWRRDELSQVIVHIRLPDSIVATPDGCSRSSPCKTKRCSSASARVACSLMCSCRGDIKNCQNEVIINSKF